MSECEFCEEEVEEPAHAVVNGRVYVDDETTCSNCGFSDDELLEWLEEHQPASLTLIELKKRLGVEVDEPYVVNVGDSFDVDERVFEVDATSDAEAKTTALETIDATDHDPDEVDIVYTPE